MANPPERMSSEIDEAGTSTSPLALPTLSHLCESPDEFLDQLDIAALNLMCASGLRCADNLDAGQLLDWLDEAAHHVELETRRHWYRFHDSPGTYNNSPGYFCCYFLLQALQEDLGVKYNPARVRDPSFQDPKCLEPDFSDSRDLFIHGIIDGPGGTCASMPVLYVAVGRRLGYPLYLVEGRGHLFFRWDDPRGERLGIAETFNVEGAGEGISSYPDDHYRTWPEPWSAADEAGGWYLKSLTPTEELAAFLSTRGECLLDNRRLEDAIQAYRWVCGLLPGNLRYRSRLENFIRRRPSAILDIQEIIAFSRAARERAQPGMLPGLSGNRSAPPAPPHNYACQCFDCQRALQALEGKGHPGHGALCGCSLCRRSRESVSPPPAPGHPPSCACTQCRQTHRQARNSNHSRRPR